jgi:hypothetical protein
VELLCAITKNAQLIIYVVDLKSVSIAATINRTVGTFATALLNGQLFFPGTSADVLVYNTTSLQQIRQIKFSGMGGVSGLATSTTNNGSYLYISDSNSHLHRIDLSVTDTVLKVTWTLPAKPNALSVTSIGNVLVATQTDQILEYTPDGALVRNVSDNNGTTQALEVNSSVWVVSRSGPVGGLALISTNGTLLKSLTSWSGTGCTRFNVPRTMAMDTNGYIIVVDWWFKCVVVVNPTLTISHALTLPAGLALSGPYAVSFEQSRGRLYIGEQYNPRRIIVLDILDDAT